MIQSRAVPFCLMQKWGPLSLALLYAWWRQQIAVHSSAHRRIEKIGKEINWYVTWNRDRHPGWSKQDTISCIFHTCAGAIVRYSTRRHTTWLVYPTNQPEAMYMQKKQWRLQHKISRPDIVHNMDTACNQAKTAIVQTILGMHIIFFNVQSITYCLNCSNI
jgi:hypothetical protein